jgi:hypothetical protein
MVPSGLSSRPTEPVGPVPRRGCCFTRDSLGALDGARHAGVRGQPVLLDRVRGAGVASPAISPGPLMGPTVLGCPATGSCWTGSEARVLVHPGSFRALDGARHAGVRGQPVLLDRFRGAGVASPAIPSGHLMGPAMLGARPTVAVGPLPRDECCFTRDFPRALGGARRAGWRRSPVVDRFLRLGVAAPGVARGPLIGPPCWGAPGGAGGRLVTPSTGCSPP